MNLNNYGRRAWQFFVLSLLFCGGISHGQTSDPKASRDHEVTVVITAIDRDENLVEIRTEDLKITEDGEPRQITHFQQFKDSAITIALIIDVSLSQERTLDAQKRAATSFVNSVIRPDRDSAAVATFTNTIHFEQQPTNDLALLRSTIERAQISRPIGYRGGVIIGPPVRSNSPPPIGSSAIWDAVKKTCEGWRFSSDLSTRRAIVLLTDGQDTVSTTKLTQAAECANQKNIGVYSIGIGDDRYEGVNKNALRTLSEETGGRAYFPKKTDDLSAEFEQIARLMRNYYVLSYKSINTKPASKVRIGIANPTLKGIQLFYEQMVSH